MKYSYDYTDLIDRIKNDIENGKFSQIDTLVITRKSEPLSHGGFILSDELHPTGYFPVIDYKLVDDLNNTEYELLTAINLLEELEAWERIV